MGLERKHSGNCDLECVHAHTAFICQTVIVYFPFFTAVKCHSIFGLLVLCLYLCFDFTKI